MNRYLSWVFLEKCQHFLGNFFQKWDISELLQYIWSSISLATYNVNMWHNFTMHSRHHWSKTLKIGRLLRMIERWTFFQSPLTCTGLFWSKHQLSFCNERLIRIGMREKTFWNPSIFSRSLLHHFRIHPSVAEQPASNRSFSRYFSRHICCRRRPSPLHRYSLVFPPELDSFLVLSNGRTDELLLPVAAAHTQLVNAHNSRIEKTKLDWTELLLLLNLDDQPQRKQHRSLNEPFNVFHNKFEQKVLVQGEKLRVEGIKPYSSKFA